MARQRTFDESHALALYKAHKNDREIAETLKVPTDTISSWRRQRKLPSITEIGSHYTKALNPKQAKEMNDFLNALLRANEEAKEAEVKPDVGHFINVYSGRYKTQEEKRIEHIWAVRKSRVKAL